MLKDNVNISKSKGNRHLPLFFFAFFLQSILSLNALAAESASVGVVNVTFLMENSPQAEIASIKLKKKFSPQEKKLAADLNSINALELELNELKVSRKNVDLQRQKERELRTQKRLRSRSLQDFREELRFARDVALDEVQKEVFRAIAEVREQQEIDIILQDYISASKRVDITPLVLDYLKSKAEKPQSSITEKTSNK